MNLPLAIHYLAKNSYNRITSFLIYYYSKIFPLKNNGTLYCVVGVHRSGTSALTGAMFNMKFPMEDNFSAPRQENIKGFFEDKDLVRIHENILLKHGLKWYELDQHKLDISNSKLDKALVKFFYRRIYEHKNFVVKDPRICLLLPLYEKLAKHLRLKIKLIIIDRDSSHVSKSLSKRPYSFDSAKVDFNSVVSIYKENIVKHKFLFDNMELEFDHLMNQPRKVLEAVIHFTNQTELEKHIDSGIKFIEPSLVNN